MIEPPATMECFQMSWERSEYYTAQVSFFQAVSGALGFLPRAEAEEMARNSIAQLECMGRAVAEREIQAGVADLLAITLTWDPQRRQDLDEALSRRGIMTTRQVEQIALGRAAIVIRRGRIVDDVEYAELQALLESELPSNILREIQSLVDAYALE